jgi:lysophospholipase L1-like esterase
VTTWGAAPTRVDNSKEKVGSSTETYHQFARISLGGSAVRLVLSNEFGVEPLTVSSTTVALQAGAPASPAAFQGAASIIIPPGSFVVSDPIALKVLPLQTLAVDLTIPQQPLTILTSHPDATRTNFAGTTPYTHVYFLKAIDVQAPGDAAAIVAFGDSITDGYKSTPSSNSRWPDILAERFQADPRTRNLAVVNEGISGNRLLRDLGGPDALARFDRDVLGLSGVRYLIVLEGINDIGHVNRPAFPGDHVTAADLTFALSQLIERAHGHGIRVFAGTLTPYPGKTPDAEQIVALQRDENDWILHNKDLDGVIDFYALTHDPAHPDTMLPAYDSGDHLHPGDAGYKAMAYSIDFKLFTSK